MNLRTSEPQNPRTQNLKIPEPPIEHEVKLAFESVEAARLAIERAGGRLVVSRRLLVDALYDTPDGQLHRQGSGLRVRRDGARGALTFKGPVLPGPVKSRDEFETPIDSPDAAERIVRGLGFQRWFLGEKYREEYQLDNAHVTIDEAPIGVYVEIEADPDEIEGTAAKLGRAPADYRLESYPRLYFAWCDAHGVPRGDMTFQETQDFKLKTQNSRREVS